MIDVVSGSGLGLFNSQKDDLRRASVDLAAGHNRITVNSATGNLVIDHQDQTLFGNALNLQLTRVYNSQGRFDDDNQDQFRFDVNRRVLNLEGSLNQIGSSVQRVNGDGNLARFTWDNEAQAYVSSDGAGAHDTLVFEENNWRYTEGSSGIVDEYVWDGQHGRLSLTRDPEGNVIRYHYHDNGFIHRLEDNLGNELVIDYVGDFAQGISIKRYGKNLQTVQYFYDDLGRLSTVAFDLTPTDQMDEVSYITHYTK